MTRERRGQAKIQRASAKPAQLRRRTQERLKVKAPEKEADPQRLLHELQVHHIELELHNKEFQQSKQESEDRYHSLFEHSPEAMLLTVPNGRILAANPAACRMFGRTEQEMCRLGRDGLVDPTDPRLAAALAERAQTGKARCELTFVRSDGTRFPGQASSDVFKDRNGLPRTSTVIRDITEQKRTDEALRESETLFRSLGACLPLGVFLTDAAGQLVYSNPRCRALLGLGLMQTAGEGWARSLHPDDRDRIMQKWFTALREGKEFSDEFRVQTRTGVRWLSVRTAPTLCEHGELTGHVATLEDITEHKRTREALQEQSRLAQVFINALPCVAFLLDHNRVVVKPNQAAVNAGAVVGTQCFRTWMQRNDPCPWCLAPTALATGQAQQVAVERVGIVWDAYWLPVGPTLCLHYAFDITERKRADEQLRVHERQLRSLASELAVAEQRERRRVAGLLHDDVIQSLALCRIKLGGLQQRVPTPDLAAAVEAIRKVIEGIIQQARTLTLQLSPPILHELGLEAALDWLAEQIQTERGLACRFSHDGQPKPLAEDVKVLLFTGVRELLHNVIKHAQASQASVSVRAEGERILVTVEDDGVGFDTSRRAMPAGKTAGFGLFNLHERFSYVGGHCEVQSEPGHGTRVMLVAPLKLQPT